LEKNGVGRESADLIATNETVFVVVEGNKVTLVGARHVGGDDPLETTRRLNIGMMKQDALNGKSKGIQGQARQCWTSSGAVVVAAAGVAAAAAARASSAESRSASSASASAS